MTDRQRRIEHGELMPLRLTWTDLPTLAMFEWLWTDIEGDGAHLSATPPASEPPGMDLLFGWSSDSWVRLRAEDGGELVGARLVISDDPLVEVTQTPLLSWGNDRRVRLSQQLRETTKIRVPMMRTVVVETSPAQLSELQFFGLDRP